MRITWWVLLVGALVLQGCANKSESVEAKQYIASAEFNATQVELDCKTKDSKKTLVVAGAFRLPDAPEDLKTFRIDVQLVRLTKDGQEVICASEIGKVHRDEDGVYRYAIDVEGDHLKGGSYRLKTVESTRQTRILASKLITVE